MSEPERVCVVVLQTDLVYRETINNVRSYIISGVTLILGIRSRNRQVFFFTTTDSEFVHEPFQITINGKVIFWPSEDNYEVLKKWVLDILEKLNGRQIRVIDEKIIKLARGHGYTPQIEQKPAITGIWDPFGSVDLATKVLTKDIDKPKAKVALQILDVFIAKKVLRLEVEVVRQHLGIKRFSLDRILLNRAIDLLRQMKVIGRDRTEFYLLEPSQETKNYSKMREWIKSIRKLLRLS